MHKHKIVPRNIEHRDCEREEKGKYNHQLKIVEDASANGSIKEKKVHRSILLAKSQLIVGF